MRVLCSSALVIGLFLAAAPVVMGADPSATAPAAEAGAGEAAAPIEQLHDVLATEGASDAFGGAIVVGQDGQEALAEGYGLQASGEPYAADTPFDIASLGKMFTAVAIAQLLEAGGLTLEDRAGDHVPDLPAGVAGATVAQLLSHSSGLGDSIDEGIVGEAGTFRYTNAGFDVLAMIVESVSGQSFESYLSEHVFGPAGMDDTILPDPGPAEAPIGWGGETSTARDLVRFIEALLRNRLLSPETTELLITPKVETDHGSHYGYGFEIFGDPDGEASFGHWGAADLFLGWVNASESLGYTLVALCDRGCDTMGPPIIGFVEAIGMPF